jgi:hypothetical protein
MACGLSVLPVAAYMLRLRKDTHHFVSHCLAVCLFDWWLVPRQQAVLLAQCAATYFRLKRVCGLADVSSSSSSSSSVG